MLPGIKLNRCLLQCHGTVDKSSHDAISIFPHFDNESFSLSTHRVYGAFGHVVKFRQSFWPGRLQIAIAIARNIPSYHQFKGRWTTDVEFDLFGWLDKLAKSQTTRLVKRVSDPELRPQAHPTPAPDQETVRPMRVRRMNRSN